MIREEASGRFCISATWTGLESMTEHGGGRRERGGSNNKLCITILRSSRNFASRVSAFLGCIASLLPKSRQLADDSGRTTMKTDKHETISIPGQEPWVGLEAACNHLGISKVTMRRWIKGGHMTPKRTPGGEFRFRLSELDQLLS